MSRCGSENRRMGPSADILVVHHPAPGGPAFFAYSTNYLIDVEAGIIVDVEATPALRTDEVNSTRTMIDRVEERFEMKPERLIGDTAYGSAEILGWMLLFSPPA